MKLRPRPLGAHGEGSGIRTPGVTTICNAPFASMYLDPRGRVLACCMNNYQPLGNIADSSLREIWQGEAAQKLRERLRRNDLSLGCELCAAKVAAGSRETAFMHVFDDLEVTEADPRWPTQLELALSNVCNLQCVMCNGDLSSSIRIHREKRPALPVVYDDEFFEELDEFLPHLKRITFLGGEPFLGREPLRVMERLAELGLRPRCHVTTNGTQWNDRVERILDAVPMHVAVSVDGLSPETLASVRVGVDPDLLMSNVISLRDAARAGGGGSSLAFCMMQPTWSEFPAYLAWADSVDLDVFVNSVTYPPRFSLAHLSHEELDEVVETLTAQDEAMLNTLVRNREVWSRTLDELTGLRSQRHGEPAARSVSVDRELPNARDRRARQICSDAADGRGVVTVATDTHQIIERVEPDASDALGINLRTYIGASMLDMVDALRSSMGPIVSTEMVHLDDGLEKRRTVFSDGTATSTVTAVLVVGRSGEQKWFLGAVTDV